MAQARNQSPLFVIDGGNKTQQETENESKTILVYFVPFKRKKCSSAGWIIICLDQESCSDSEKTQDRCSEDPGGHQSSAFRRLPGPARRKLFSGPDRFIPSCLPGYSAELCPLPIPYFLRISSTGAMGEPKYALHRYGVRLRGAHRQRERVGVMRRVTASLFYLFSCSNRPCWLGVTDYFILCFFVSDHPSHRKPAPVVWSPIFGCWCTFV